MVWTAVTLVAAATGYGLWAFLSGPNLSQYAPVIAEISAGKLNDDGSGRIDLSKTFPGLTPQDEMFLKRRPDGSFVAMFPNYYAKGPSIAGLIYTSRPLNDQDTYTRARSISFDKPLIAIGTWQRLGIDQKINDNWYKVSYGM